MLAKEVFARVFVSPLQRARATCELAGLSNSAVTDAGLMEWNNGRYEGLTPKQIHEGAPGWLIFRDVYRRFEPPAPKRELVLAWLPQLAARRCVQELARGLRRALAAHPAVDRTPSTISAGATASRRRGRR